MSYTMYPYLNVDNLVWWKTGTSETIGVLGCIQLSYIGLQNKRVSEFLSCVYYFSEFYNPGMPIFTRTGSDPGFSKVLDLAYPEPTLD